MRLKLAETGLGTNPTASRIVTRFVENPDPFFACFGFPYLRRLLRAFRADPAIGPGSPNPLKRLMGQTPEAFWLGLGLRQAQKVHAARRVFAEAGITGSEEITSHVLNGVRAVGNTQERPFFIMGAGGSGSTWLGAMLGDLPGFHYAREVALPPVVSYLARRRPGGEVTTAIRAIMLLHSWATEPSFVGTVHEFVNSARSIHDYDVLRAVWPRGRFVYLLRDPRDQVLSTTYRKMKYRRQAAPFADDNRYLQFNARKNVRFYRLVEHIDPTEVYRVQYEDVKRDPMKLLSGLLQWAEVEVDAPTLRMVVESNDAENMREGRVPFRGNLDQGGRAQSWCATMTPRQKEQLKPILNEVLASMGYPQDW